MLNSCPKCGRKESINYWKFDEDYSVLCGHCGAQTKFYETAEVAKLVWNNNRAGQIRTDRKYYRSGTIRDAYEPALY